jgi:glucokinase
VQVGIDLSPSSIRAAVVDLAADPPRLHGRQRRSEPVEPSWRQGPDAVAGQLAASATAAAERAGLALDELAAVGCAVAGQVDHGAGVVYGDAGEGIPPIRLAERLTALLGGIPVFVDRDTAAAALAEAAAGAARGARDFVYVAVSARVCATIVANGRMVRGAAGTAGEIGHWPVTADGPRCACGAFGCLDQLASGRALATRSGAPSAEVAFEAAARDGQAADAVATMGSVLAGMAVGLVNLLGPELIVVGGELAARRPVHVIEPMREAVATRAIEEAATAVRIVPAALGADGALIGAALEARERLAGRATWFL